MSRTYRFFQEELAGIGERIRLTPANARIAKSVLRLQSGSRIVLVNGKGEIAHADLVEVGQRRATGHIVDRKELSPPFPEISLLQGFPKGEKAKWIVQKGVEWGVSRILFFETGRTVPKKKKEAQKQIRWKRIAIEALRQSGNPFLPEILGPLQLSEAVRLTRAKTSILFDEGEPHRKLRHILQDDISASIVVAIGPEGGFSEADRTLLVDAGYQPARLGPYILRTETAALSALAAVRALVG